jgi:hypothetical protein
VLRLILHGINKPVPLFLMVKIIGVRARERAREREISEEILINKKSK